MTDDPNRAAELPEDTSAWPRDPYLLLGVSRRAERRTIRVAYTRLIRRFKPEFYPKQFCLIREAYERITHSQGQGSREDSPDEHLSSIDRVTRDALAKVRRHFPENDAAPPARAVDGDELPAHWQLACAGDRSAAYWRLVAEQQRRPRQQRVYAMLYWLLSVEPELDPGREPCDWLTAGLVEYGCDDVLTALYEREVARRPSEALSARFERLLEDESGAAPLALLYRWRWSALAGRIDNLETLLGDLQALARRLTPGAPEWNALLPIALSHLAWLGQTSGGEAAFERYMREAAQCNVLDRPMGAALDALDWELLVAIECRRFAGDESAQRMLEAIEAVCRLPLAAARPFVLRWINELLRDRRVSLGKCDRLVSRAPTAVDRLATHLELLDPHPTFRINHQGSAVELDRAVLEFFNRPRQLPYEKLRWQLLDFCVHEALPPAEMAAVLLLREEQIGGKVAIYAHAIRDDLALRTVWLGTRVIGG
ncbi:MAG: hypothetical protein AB7O59_20445 [Pirellulales bacterium]